MCIQGWKVETKTTIYELIEAYMPVLKERDVYGYCPGWNAGGVSLELYRELVARYPDITFIASGGVGGMEDIQALENVGISSVIVGKAFYENLEFKI